VFRLVDVIVFMISLSTLLVMVTACPGSEEDNSIQTCVEDLQLDVETRTKIEALRVHYEDYPTHCRYGQCSDGLIFCVKRFVALAKWIKH